jgi:uncharacterized protein YjiS (DUF1127 family)
MKALIASLSERIRGAMLRAGYERARQEMLQLPDRLLDDVGVSRELLEQGVAAWPWRKPTAADGLRGADLKPAVAELRRYNDSELNELGIARSQIETVVARGRDGIDPSYNAAA